MEIMERDARRRRFGQRADRGKDRRRTRGVAGGRAGVGQPRIAGAAHQSELPGVHAARLSARAFDYARPASGRGETRREKRTLTDLDEYRYHLFHAEALSAGARRLSERLSDRGRTWPEIAAGELSDQHRPYAIRPRQAATGD